MFIFADDFWWYSTCNVPTYIKFITSTGYTMNLMWGPIVGLHTNECSIVTVIYEINIIFSC